MTAGLMSGKRGLIMGLANERSIAWGIAKACSEQGADLAFTYQGEALGKRVTPLAASLGSDIVIPCDVADEGSLDAAFEALEACKVAGFDRLVNMDDDGDFDNIRDDERFAAFIESLGDG